MSCTRPGPTPRILPGPSPLHTGGSASRLGGASGTISSRTAIEPSGCVSGTPDSSCETAAASTGHPERYACHTGVLSRAVASPEITIGAPS